MHLIKCFPLFMHLYTLQMTNRHTTLQYEVYNIYNILYLERWIEINVLQRKSLMPSPSIRMEYTTSISICICRFMLCMPSIDLVVHTQRTSLYTHSTTDIHKCSFIGTSHSNYYFTCQKGLWRKKLLNHCCTGILSVRYIHTHQIVVEWYSH